MWLTEKSETTKPMGRAGSLFESAKGVFVLTSSCGLVGAEPLENDKSEPKLTFRPVSVGTLTC